MWGIGCLPVGGISPSRVAKMERKMVASMSLDARSNLMVISTLPGRMRAESSFSM